MYQYTRNIHHSYYYLGFVQILIIIKDFNKVNKLDRIDLLCTSDNDDLSLLLEELIIDDDSQIRTKCINIMTIHKSKWLEFKVVIIRLNDGIPSKANTVDQYDEERRICYVAMTRAKERLLLTSSRQHFISGKKKILRPSPFIKECRNK